MGPTAAEWDEKVATYRCKTKSMDMLIISMKTAF